jgi:hypothetical protein
MTRIDVGLNKICSNYHEHEIYEEKWCKDKPKDKPKKNIKTKTKPRKANIKKNPPKCN